MHKPRDPFVLGLFIAVVVGIGKLIELFAWLYGSFGEYIWFLELYFANLLSIHGESSARRISQPLEIPILRASIA